MLFTSISHCFTGIPSIYPGVNNTMSKAQRSNREGKKQALLTPKEKKAAKRAKKHAGDITHLVIKGS
jgi:hypothetical protein